LFWFSPARPLARIVVLLRRTAAASCLGLNVIPRLRNPLPPAPLLGGCIYIVPFYSCALTHCDRAVRTCSQYRNPSTPLCAVLVKHFSVRISRLSYRNWPSAGAPVGQSGVFSFLDGGSRLRLNKHTTGNVGSATIITRLDQRRHNFMAMKKSDYLSDVWKDGIFSKPCRSQGL
jgi:hypothetical protein